MHQSARLELSMQRKVEMLREETRENIVRKYFHQNQNKIKFCKIFSDTTTVKGSG